MNEAKNLKNEQFLRPYFWSYDFDRLDRIADRRLIIFQLLNFGNRQATDWLRETYADNEIHSVIENSIATAWDRKSLALWSFVFGVTPRKNTRFS